MRPPRRPFEGTIRPAELTDEASIRKILELRMSEHGVIRHDEVERTIDLIKASINGEHPNEYLVAITRYYSFAGLMGLTMANIDQEFVEPDEVPCELIHAYVNPIHSRRGAGRALANTLEKRAVELGATHILIVTGSRNREGYGFWDKLYGRNFRRDEDFFGPGGERLVWKRALSPPNLEESAAGVTPQ